MTGNVTTDYETSLEEIRAYLFRLGRIGVEFYQLGSLIFPWDITETAATYYHTSVLGMLIGDWEAKMQFELPIQFRKGAKVYEHHLNAEFAFGILLLANAAKLPIEARLFGEPLEYFELTNDRFSDPERPYAIEVGGRDYYFYTLDFLQGFKTGALWAGLNHHHYWRNFRMINHQTGQITQHQFE